jgi:phosphoribosylformylglycinamidine synthase
LHISYAGDTCAFIDIDFLKSGFPQWEFDAVWSSPGHRGLHEPVLGEPADYNRMLTDILSSPNISSKEWICRQYDHEVQGSSVIKPLVGAQRDVNSDAAVLRPVLESERGLVFSQALIPFYSPIDAYHMTCCTIDEAVRRLVAVGGTPAHIGGVDNFCWPSIQYHPEDNPDGKFKAAQLVRSCLALRDMCLAYQIPLLSGKDSMYVDGYLPGRYGETHKVSALETLQFSAIGVIADINTCVTMDVKMPGDMVYVLGVTKNELGGSAYYECLGYTGLHVPEVWSDQFMTTYNGLALAIREGWVASAHGIYRGGLGIHLAMKAMGGNLGMDVDLRKIPAEGIDRDDSLLFSESAGRFIVTIDPQNKKQFETVFKGGPCTCIGQVTERPDLVIRGLGENTIVTLGVTELKKAWKKPFGALI